MSEPFEAHRYFDEFGTSIFHVERIGDYDTQLVTANEDKARKHADNLNAAEKGGDDGD